MSAEIEAARRKVKELRELGEGAELIARAEENLARLLGQTQQPAEEVTQSQPEVEAEAEGE